MAAATCAEIRAWRRNPVWRGLEYLVDGGAGEAAFFLNDRRANFFCGKHKWSKDRLSLRKPGEAIAAVHELFNGQIHR